MLTSIYQPAGMAAIAGFISEILAVESFGHSQGSSSFSHSGWASEKQ
jgi:hypothetical protein